MKKTLLFALMLLALNSFSQLKLTYVNPATDEIRIKNFGASSVDITNYRLCALFEYVNLVQPAVTILNGDFNLSMNEEVSIAWASNTGFNTTASDLGLYLPTGAFSSAASMVDFMEYGAAGQGRENVANTAGIWTAGVFLTGTGPWYYIGDGTASGLSQWTDQLVVGPNMDVRINEVDPDQPSTDTQEFIELYGEPNAALDGLVIVLISGAPSDLSYDSYDLDGYSLDANGFFVLGSATVPSVDLTLNGALQNGADAVALYVGNSSDWPTSTPATATGLVDAMVYGTNDPSDDGLIATLTPGQVQLNDAANTANSFSRVPDGGDAFDLTSYFVQGPTPGYSNVPLCLGGNVELVSGEVNQCSETSNDPVVVVTSSTYGDVYTYILTDASDLIIAISADGSFDLNTQLDGDYHIWGFSYNGILDANSIVAGQPASGITADVCHSLSTNFILVSRSVCSINICDGGTVQTTTGTTYVSLCLDTEPDVYSFEYQNSSNADGYSYVLADSSGNIVQMIDVVDFDFNSLTAGNYFVHGISFFTGLDLSTTEPGDSLTGITGLGDCLDLSDNSIEVHVIDCTLGEGCSRLFISEYMEGTSNNKALEIYNPTPFPVDLSDYDLFAYANGSVDYTSVVALAGTLQPGGVYVIANSQADAAILAEADMTASIATFNGNDAIALVYNLDIIDVIGVIGEDPGSSGWQFGLNSTVDHVLVRNIDINSPTTNWELSAGQWTGYAASDYTHLGSHAAQACAGDAFVTFDVSAMEIEENAGTIDVTVTAYNVSVDVPITIDISGATALAGEDFVSIFPLTYTFTPSNTAQVFTIEIIDDLLEEDTYEYFTITMNDDNDVATFVNQNLTISIAPSDQTYPLYDIGEIVTETTDGIADSLDIFCSITGIVHGINFNPAGTEFTLIDGTGGIKIFDADNSYGYDVLEGDSIVVFGQVTQFMGMTEFFPDQIIYVDGNHTLEVPTLVTTLGEANESHMVHITCVSLINPEQWTQVGSGFDVDVTDGTNNFVMHIDLNTDIYAGPAPEGHFSVTGIGAQQDPNSPLDGNYVFWPRALNDYSESVVASFALPSTVVYGDNGLALDISNNSTGGTNYQWEFGDGNSSTSNAATVSHDYTYLFLSGVTQLTVSLTISNLNGCSDVSSNTVDLIYSALSENTADSFTLYPNPSSGQLNILNTSVIESLRIFDMNGRRVFEQNNFVGRSVSMDIQNIPAGSYMVEVRTPSGIAQKQLIKL